MALAAASTVGLDFGTSTCFAVRAGQGRLILGEGTTPYMRAIAGVMAGKVLAGEKTSILPPDRIIRSAKRALTDNLAKIPIGGQFAKREIDVDRVVTAILKELRDRARHAGYPFNARDRLRLGCPAMWTYDQRQRLTQSVTASGLPVKRAEIVEEPVAAGIAWLDKHAGSSESVDGRMLVFDMGGGTLDIAVMQVAGGPAPQVTVLTSVGAASAGDALDESITRDIAQHYEVDINGAEDPVRVWHELLELALSTKIGLSVDTSHDILPTARIFGRSTMPPFRYPRERLEEIFAPQLDQAEELIVRALRLARLAEHGGANPADILKLTPEILSKEIRYILLVGGMSRVPAVHRRLKAVFPAAELIHDASVADEAIVNGLASTTEYNITNMYRPGFEFRLTWPGGSELLYRPYTPLFDPWQLQTGQSRIGHRHHLKANSLPHGQCGQLEVFSANGDPVNFTHRLIAVGDKEPEVMNALAVPFGHHDVGFALYSDGRIHLTDGHGHGHELRVAGWPVIRGSAAQSP